MSEIEQVTVSMNGFEVNSYVVHAPEGDIIVDVAGQAVTTPNDVVAGVRTARESGRKVVLMRVKNREGTRFVALSLAGNNPG